MTTEGGKNWNRPWSSEEILENAENWSLAGDAALLNTLKAFADNLLTKTGAISERIDTLLNNLNEASLKLDLSQNEFQGLKHTQFIESRVYEDDETLDSTVDQKSEEKAVSEEEQEKQIVESIKNGMVILNDYYDKIEISISDSEEETERSFTLKPKDKYAHRPLPPIIGTPDWYKKWNLEDVTSESESDKLSEIYSESDSEDNLPKDLMKGSESSSELDFSSHVSENRPIANSSFNDSVQKPDLLSSSEESDQESLPVKTPLSNKSFAEQLAAKLGNVISQQEEISPEVNKKRIQPIKANNFAGGSFNDEPPPLDNSEDFIVEKDNNNSGLFSGGKGLFDDKEDELFWGQQPTIPKPQKKSNLFEDDKSEELPPPLQVSQKSINLPKSSQVSKGLFDSDDSSDDDIFSAGIKHVSKPTYLQPNKPTVPLFDEVPPKLEDKKPVSEEPKIKKPVGAVSIFGTSDLFGDQNITDILKKSKKPVVPRTVNKDNGTESIVDTSKTNKTVSKRKNLFDEDEDNSEIVPKPKSEINNSKTKSVNLFGDSDENSSEINVKKEGFNQSQEPAEDKKSLEDSTDGVSVSETFKPKKIGLFDDEDDIQDNSQKPKKISLFDDDDDLFKDDIFADITTKPGLKLFSDLEDSLDIFGHKQESCITDIEPPKIEINVKGKEKQPEDVLIEKKPDILSQDLNVSIASQVNNSIVKKLLNEKKVNMLFSDSSEEETDNDNNKYKENIFGISNRHSSEKDDKDIFEDISNKNSSKKDEDKDILVTNVHRKEELPDKSKNETVEIEPKKTVAEVNQPPMLEKKKFKGLFSDSEEDDDDEDIFRIKTKEKSLSVTEQKDEPNKVDIFIQDSVNVANVSQHDLEKKKPESLLTSEVEDSVSEIKTNYLDENQLESTATSEKEMNDDSKTPTDYSIKNDRSADINIFASSPPPDDVDDWETKSDSLSDDDFLSYRTENNSERSVFDNEPPMLEPNESSGIVKDATRIDSDYFSFYPDASSSRRLSSDIFSDQQLQDSFYITKNKPESTKMPSNLNSIPETSKSSILEITPSGDIKDFESTVASSQDAIPSIEQTENISVEIENDPPSKSLPDKIDDVEDNVTPELPKPTEKSMKNKISLISELLKNKPVRTPQNYAKEIKENSEKANQESSENVAVLHCVAKTRAKIPIKRRPSSRRARQEAIRKSAADLDNVSITDSEEKQEQESTGNVPNKQNEMLAVSTNIEEILANEPEFKNPSTEKRLFENNPETPPKQEHSTNTFLDKSEALPIKITDEKKEILFNDSISDEDSLFAATSKKPNVTKAKDSLFDSDGDSDNELFGTAKPSGAAKPIKVETEKVAASAPKKSLFEDNSSSDDDLFLGAKKPRKIESIKAITTKTSKIATTKKLENIKSDDDPLSKLLK